MATMTVNVNDEVLQEFRKAAAARYGTKKGALGKAITQAMDEWSKKKAAKEFLELLEKGFDMGGKTYKHRSELYRY